MKEIETNDLTLCVLISCMFQEKSIIEQTNIQTNVVVVNQCNEESVEEWDFINSDGRNCHAKFISTKERGLSRSRNVAIRNAIGNICLICDDDEVLVDGYEKIIIDAYKKIPQADVITFSFAQRRKKYLNRIKKHSLSSILRTSSVEVSFKKNAIFEKEIVFDEKMGSGTGNGGGEENMFLITCKRRNLNMFYFPTQIGILSSCDSQWFKGFTPTYFENFGWTSRRMLGPIVSIAYFIYWLLSHRGLYCKEIPVCHVIKSYFIGWKSKR